MNYEDSGPGSVWHSYLSILESGASRDSGISTKNKLSDLFPILDPSQQAAGPSEAVEQAETDQPEGAPEPTPEPVAEPEEGNPEIEESARQEVEVHEKQTPPKPAQDIEEGEEETEQVAGLGEMPTPDSAHPVPPASGKSVEEQLSQEKERGKKLKMQMRRMEMELHKKGPSS
jgi:hypothetical protein